MKKITFLLLFALLINADETQEEKEVEIDPFEKMNRVVFNISDSIDQNFLRPTAEIYSEYTPLFVKDSVTNFFHNITEIDTVINQLLQGKPKLAAQDTLRFLINTTIGVGGIFDVASRMGFERHDEDFGQTLGYWGISSGPYVFIPFVGPSTVRDVFGIPLSWYVLYRTRFGLRLRAVGENPAAVDTAGISVIKLRYYSIIICGLLCGLAGAYLSTGLAAGFVKDMSAGRGFIALAALIFAKWRPWHILSATLLFGLLEAISNRFQNIDFFGFILPIQLMQALPYILTVIILAGFVGKAIPPLAGGIPYTKE